MPDLTPPSPQALAPLQIERLSDADGAVLRLRGELDLSSTDELERCIAEVRADRPGRLLLDLSELEFMDSTGLALLIRTAQQAQEDGASFRLRTGLPQVQRLFALTGVLDRFTFEP
jgi:anti-anti-sigma factor